MAPTGAAKCDLWEPRSSVRSAGSIFVDCGKGVRKSAQAWGTTLPGCLCLHHDDLPGSLSKVHAQHGFATMQSSRQTEYAILPFHVVDRSIYVLQAALSLYSPTVPALVKCWKCWEGVLDMLQLLLSILLLSAFERSQACQRIYQSLFFIRRLGRAGNTTGLGTLFATTAFAGDWRAGLLALPVPRRLRVKVIGDFVIVKRIRKTFARANALRRPLAFCCMSYGLGGTI